MRPDPSPDPALPPRPAEPPSPSARRAWIAPGLGLAGALALGRTLVLARLAESARGVEPELARWAAAGRLPATAVGALVLGLVAAALALRGRARPALGLALGALAAVSALSGWPGAPAAELAFGPLVIGLSIAAGIGLAGATWLARGETARRALGSTATLALAGLVGLALPFGWIARAAAVAPRMALREVVTDLVQSPGRFAVLEADEGHPPAPGVLSPLVDHRYDTADKPAMVMPPGATLELVVAGEEDGARLYAAAGVDLSVRRLVEQHGQELRVRFELSIDGEARFDETLVVRGENALREADRLAEAEWRHVGGAEGLALAAGQRVRLRTSLPDFEGRALPEVARGLALGFGGLTIERRPTRPRTTATPERPNLVLIVMDTLRADRMSCYGYEKPTTPHVDRLAAEGLVFERAYSSSSWTWPSTASLLTGLLPDEHGVTSNASCTLGLAYETVAEALQARGFTTAAISCNPLIAPERYFDQGFERFDSAPEMRESIEVADELVATVERLADARFFLYLHLADPHTPHQPLPAELARLGGEKPADFPDMEVRGHRLDGLDVYATRLLKGEALDDEGRSRPERIVPPEHAQWIHDAYDASVGTGDHFTGLVLQTLERLGLDDRTIVAFTSDHGEELFDHGLLAHGHTVHRELVHVPLVIAGPGIPRGERVPWEVSNRHLAGTLARIGGAALRAPRDFVDLLGPAPPGPAVFYQTEKGWWEGHRKDAADGPLRLYGLRADGFVAHRALGEGDWCGALEAGPPRALYRMEDDLSEQVDLSALPPHRERGLEMSARIESWLERQREARRAGALAAGASARTALDGLGYVHDEPPPRHVCPAHPEVERDAPGSCPRCGAALVESEAGER